MLLAAQELPMYYALADKMAATEVSTYLQRANSYCLGYIGGYPPLLAWDPDQRNLKVVVAMAFEILAEGQQGQTNATNGNITIAAPSQEFQRSDRSNKPLGTVDKMLDPYRAAYEQSNSSSIDKGFMFLGG
ncbi:hypothetical protein [Paenibacillus agilis]|uniref:Uncharacterized protein n=1 Tax=Paenibacillus agilis TaxID=3020863 RepID=A0A559IX51_9BACL|nr:hypothetical protein [Paenibacillus agilis]TVX92218.1 hypothetical protein FPZ44_03585 [Paenibacillus agilis]